MTRHYTAFIFARGGSKGVPHKNIIEVAGKPLIAHTIETALASGSVSRVVVSTDDEAIAKVATKYGAETLMRPDELAQDATPELLAWHHAMEAEAALFSGDTAQPFISLPATSPLRAADDIDNAVARLEQGDCDIVFGISPSNRSPYLNMVTVNEADQIEVMMAGSDAVRRQDVPDAYDITTCVYVGDAGYIRSCEKLMQGSVGYVIIPAERALDIDTHYDVYLADLLLSQPYKGE